MNTTKMEKKCRKLLLQHNLDITVRKNIKNYIDNINHIKHLEYINKYENDILSKLIKLERKNKEKNASKIETLKELYMFLLKYKRKVENRIIIT